MLLRPFWCYYGGKWRAARKYPPPQHSHIVEPFAGAAGYSLRYPDQDVTLIDAYPVVAGVWRYLTKVTSAEVLRIPVVESVDDLPAWVPQEARWLVGFNMNKAVSRPCKTLSHGIKARSAKGWVDGWGEKMRDRVASQVQYVRHWKVIEGDYTTAPDVEATWFVDPPYNNLPGKRYPLHDLDYPSLGEWCRGRRGQVVVCENEGATWLPFQAFGAFKAGMGRKWSMEVVWTNESLLTPDFIQGRVSAHEKLDH